MPFVIIIVGAVLLIAAIQGTERDLGKLLYSDAGFVWWVLAIVCVGAIGYIDRFKKFSDGLLALILISLVMREQGFVQQFIQAVRSGSTNPQALPADSQQAPTSGGGGGSSGNSGGGGILGAVAQAAPFVASAFG